MRTQVRKQSKKYFFSVEGETEKWYLEWLQKTINEKDSAEYHVRFDVKVEKSPISRMKSLVPISRTEIYHVFDREGVSPEQTKAFRKTLTDMKKAQSMGKKIKYYSAYSNLSFDLWIILHKQDCRGHKNKCDDYLAQINKCYDKNFESMDEYKKEKNFERVLHKIDLSDVNAAVRRAADIMRERDRNGDIVREHMGYRYYDENPSTELGVRVGKILEECGV